MSRWALPSNRFEALGGDRAGQYSIRINDQWRVCFRWELRQPLVEGINILIAEGDAIRMLKSSTIIEEIAMASPVNGLPPIHPGEMLADELNELGLSARALADKLKVPHNRISSILAGKRAVSADTSLRLGRFFGMSEDFWLRLQTTYDIKKAKAESGAKISSDVLPLRGSSDESAAITQQ